MTVKYIYMSVIPELTTHSGMRDESWHFLSTFLENLAISVLFNAEFNGIIRILSFRHDITIKNSKN